MTDVTEVRRLFPIVDELLYFDAAALTPYSLPVLGALEKFSAERRDGASRYFEGWYLEMERCRSLLAGLLNASHDEIALTKNTSEGINLTAQLVKWEKGDEVAVCECDFPTNVYPFLNLREKGVTARFIECADGRVPIEEIERALGERTKLLSISHVFYGSGYRVDLEKVGRLCRETDTLLHVDAAQSMGAFGIDVHRSGIDFLSAPGFKWLLSPMGTGVFYADKRHIDGTPVLGWLSVKDPWNLDTRSYNVLEGAQRFECGSLNISGFLGMIAALELLKSVGAEAVEQRVLELSRLLAEGLEDAGLVVLSDLERAHRSGIICIEKGRMTKERLDELGIRATVRDNLRISPHIYNNEDDIHSLVGLLKKTV